MTKEGQRKPFCRRVVGVASKRMLPRPFQHCLPCLVRLGVVLMVCLSLGMHRGVLQTVAWARMLADFAAERPLLEAVEMTFDGEHPCELCRMAQEKDPASSPLPTTGASPAKKLLAVVCEASVPLFSPPGRTPQRSEPACVSPERHHAPEKPPPRRGEA
jgi:hypothetical protein